ncbi:alpha/beta fold hydrolase [Pontiellaceae bacterium B12219]|nr:alpha/beta fold hydrolase [Pontiellaceae bacterium B12219]
MMLKRVLGKGRTVHVYALGVLFAICSAPVFGQTDKEQQMLDSFQVEKGIVYKTVNGKKLELVYFKPQHLKAGEKAPWMLFVHGGGWRGGNKYNILRSAFSGTLKELTENGIACFTIDYRLTKNHITAFDSVVDCKDAARFLLKNASTYDLDPARYGVWGGSAGGHLSLMTALGKNEDFPGEAALADFSPNFTCVASYFPLTSLVNPEVLAGSKFEDPEVLRHVLDGLFSEKPELARLLSPTEYLSEASPPILLLHGDKDETLSITNSLYMMDVAEQNGADVELLEVRNAGHSFGGKHISPSMEEINETSAQFIISKLTAK